MAFSFEQLTLDLRTAAAQEAPEPAVRNVLTAALTQAEEMLEATSLGDEAEVQLFEDEIVSIWICRFDPDVVMPPHEHRMRVLIAGYAGAEHSLLYERSAGGLTQVGSATARAGEVIALDEGAIHAVTALDGVPSYAVHVYFGPLMAIKRDLFDWESGQAVDFTMENFDAMKRPAN